MSWSKGVSFIGIGLGVWQHRMIHRKEEARKNWAFGICKGHWEAF